MTLETSLALIALVLWLIALLTLVKLRRDRSSLTAQLTATGRRLDQATRELDTLRREREEAGLFQDNLGAAQLTTRLQQPRLTAGAGSGSSPERYRYVRILAEKGMPAEEIAAVLAISPHEVRQVLALSRIPRQPAATWKGEDG